MKLMLHSILMLILFATVSYGVINAQSISNEPSIVFSDQFPEPHQEVVAKIQGINSTDIRWFKSGNKVDRATGQKSFTFITKDLGEPTMIQVISENRLVAQNMVLPIYIDIAIEPKTFVPDQYQGRALPSADSMVRFTAMVNDGEPRENHNYQYLWKINGQTIQGGPINQNSIETRVPNRRTVKLTLSVINPGIGLIGERSMLIPLEEPDIYFYQKHSLYGMSPYTTGNPFHMKSNETTLSVAPYYVPLEIIQNHEIIRWRYNGQHFSTDFNEPLNFQVQSSPNRRQSNLEFQILSLGEILKSITSNLRINH